MSASRPLAIALVAGLLCALSVLAAPALVADAAGKHGRERRASVPHASACRRHSRRHRRCRAAPSTGQRRGAHRRRIERAAHRPAGVSEVATTTDVTGVGGGGATSTAPAGAGTAPSSNGSSPAGESGDGRTETPTTETPGAPATPRVQVTAKEYSFTLSRAEVPAGKVIVEFVNGGEDPHNLHLLEPTEGVEAGEFSTSSPGFHGDLALNLRPGSYTLFCSLPGHEAKGMKATLTVR